MRSRILLVLGILFLIGAPAFGQDSLGLKDGDPETRRLFEEGSRFFLLQDYKHAAPLYQAALDREKIHRTFNETLWRVLVDNLGMAYGVPGDLKKAKETLEYGLSKDPRYPMFHYLLACTFAEMGDVDKTIESLKLAFQYKANMIKGESFPDAWTDDSFQRFMKNDKFVEALKEMSRN
ncbi:MAG TPA: hypothetical protein VKD91_18760 [Pyrinomonadaceae bacterium]|nr:hypothetical protein [Pyrinomonadaceae bacterium]